MKNNEELIFKSDRLILNESDSEVLKETVLKEEGVDDQETLTDQQEEQTLQDIEDDRSDNVKSADELISDLLEEENGSYDKLIERANKGDLVKYFDELRGDSKITNKEIRDLIIEYFMKNEMKRPLDTIAVSDKGKERLLNIFDSSSLGCTKKNNPFITYFVKNKFAVNLTDKEVYDLANLYADNVISYDDLVNTSSVMYKEGLFKSRDQRVYDVIYDYKEYANKINVAEALEEAAKTSQKKWGQKTPFKNLSVQTNKDPLIGIFFDDKGRFLEFTDIEKNLGEIKSGDAKSVTMAGRNDNLGPNETKVSFIVNKELKDYISTDKKTGAQFIDTKKLNSLSKQERDRVLGYIIKPGE